MNRPLTSTVVGLAWFDTLAASNATSMRTPFAPETTNSCGVGRACTLTLFRNTISPISVATLMIGFSSENDLNFQRYNSEGEEIMFQELFREDGGQDIAEYAVMLAVILVLVVGTIRLVGSNANSAFSAAASAIQ